MLIKNAILVWALAGSVGFVTGYAQQPPGQAKTKAERDAEREQARFRAMDTNRDGIITRREWRGGTAGFDRFDVNRDGVLSGSEVWLPAARGRSVSADEPTGTSGQLANPTYRAGYQKGLIEGRQAGKEDKELRNQWDLEGQRELEQADSGYTPELGLRTDYQAGYRTAFRRGYREGFGPR